jgi:hypothetical protein
VNDATRLLALPDTQLCREGLELARAALPNAIVSHSVRTYLLGRAYAQRRAIDFDEEDLALAAIFHDFGLSRSRPKGSEPFQRKSSSEARAFLEAKSAGAERVRAIAEAIDFHMQLFPRWSKGNVAGLLQVGAWMDLTALRRLGVREEARIIARAYPREGVDFLFPRLLAGSISGLRSLVGLFVIS